VSIEAQRHSLTIVVPAWPLWLLTDPGRLELMLMNLLSNAARYTHPGGRIELSGSQEAGEIILRVRDNGVGLTPQDLETVFERYAHIAPPRSPDQGGLGVGLAIVRELAHLHGGTVAATSKGKGLGSEFLLRLPAAAPARIESQLEA
jgi:signal transduction histidine kinase